MYDDKLLVFAGTYEGHRLAEYCSGSNISADFCVATEYGRTLMEGISRINIIEGRLAPQDMISLIKKKGYRLIIDATHPYAGEVTKNIQAACGETGTEYMRLLREESEAERENVLKADNIEEAVRILDGTAGNILLTTGSKELSKYTGVTDFQNRVYARILPSHESLQLAFDSGIAPAHVICMQGPFGSDMNIAMMEQFSCTVLVTKNTGGPGGFEDKLAVAEKGYKVVVIGRPAEEEGYSLEAVWRKIEELYEK